MKTVTATRTNGTTVELTYGPLGFKGSIPGFRIDGRLLQVGTVWAVEGVDESGKRGLMGVANHTELQAVATKADADAKAGYLARKAAEKKHDNLYNEGGEGYNPYR